MNKSTNILVYYSLAVLAVSNALEFRSYINATLNNPNFTLTTFGQVQCAQKCELTEGCLGFSITHQPMGLIQCRISVTNISWTRDSNSTLFIPLDMNISGYTLLSDGKLYKSYLNVGTIADTRNKCTNDGATLSSPHPNNLWTTLASFMPNTVQMPIGIYATNRPMGEWTTIDGHTFNSNFQILDPNQHWGSNLPNDSTSTCVIMNYALGGMTWDDVSCALANNRTTSAVCRKTSAWIKATTGKSYRFITRNFTSQMSAEWACNKVGGTLANMFSKAVYTATEGIRMRAYGKTVYIAGSDQIQEDKWLLPDGTIVDATLKATDINQPWKSGEPKGKTEENCAGLTYVGIVDTGCSIFHSGYWAFCEKS